jgi:1-acyl-sn-glycerol-3-phosphate acyltransferase
MFKYRLLIWRIAWLLVAAVRPLIFRLRVEGTEHVPREGGGVVASNHTLGPDYILLGFASPRELYYMAKAEAFEMHPIATKILLAGGVFPVRRGKSDVAALQNAVDLARSGKLIGMFPEGTRSRTARLMRAKTGAARIALEAEVPVYPVAVIGAEEIPNRLRHWQRPEVVVRFGKPLYRTGNGDSATLARDYTNEIMGAIADLLPPEQRGEYGQGAPAEPGSDDNDGPETPDGKEPA